MSAIVDVRVQGVRAPGLEQHGRSSRVARRTARAKHAAQHQRFSTSPADKSIFSQQFRDRPFVYFPFPHLQQRTQ
jgi:hypothetical protein